MTDAARRLPVAIVDAFTDEPLAGNAAGVVPDGDGLADGQMQRIARELNASETAFLLTTGAADRRVRYFTPTTEVDLCGHATIGSHALLAEEGDIETGTHTLETNAGVIEVAVEPDGTVWMTQNQPEVRDAVVDPARVGEAIGIDPAHFVEELPIARASTGLPFLVVPVTYLSRLGDATPDSDAIAALTEELSVTGIYAFTFDTLTADATVHARMWAPGAGVPEDPVTGTASGAAGAYLRYAGAFDAMPEEMRFEQGHFVDRPGEVRVRVGESVRVGGRATVSLSGNLRVPEPDEDDIIEA